MATIVKELYEGEVVLQFSEGNHRYKLLQPLSSAGYKDGVTTPLRILNKPELLQWAANMACDTFYEAYKSDPTKTWSEAEFKELLRKARYAHISYKDARAEIGSRVHAWIEAHINGKEIEADELMKPSIEAFLRWEEKVKPKWQFSEKLIYSKQYDYCGTVDGVAEINGLETVIDFKTGSPDAEYNTRTKRYTGRRRARLDHFIQEGGYSIAINEEYPGVPVQQMLMMYIPLDGSLYTYTSDFVDFWQELFISVLHLHRALKKASTLNPYEWVERK